MKNYKNLDCCPICENGILKSEKYSKVVKFGNNSKQLENLQKLICSNCGDGFYESESEENIEKEFKQLKTYTLSELLENVNDSNLHKESNFGKDVGFEILEY